MKNIISTDKAPAAIGPYSQAVEVNGLVFTSGVVPIDPATGELVTGNRLKFRQRELLRVLRHFSKRQVRQLRMLSRQRFLSVI